MVRWFGFVRLLWMERKGWTCMREETMFRESASGGGTYRSAVGDADSKVHFHAYRKGDKGS